MLCLFVLIHRTTITTTKTGRNVKHLSLEICWPQSVKLESKCKFISKEVVAQLLPLWGLTYTCFNSVEFSIDGGWGSCIGHSIFLCWLWNVYEGAELPSVYFITNTKHCITYLALTQLFPVLLTHRIYILCSILLHFI